MKVYGPDLDALESAARSLLRARDSAEKSVLRWQCPIRLEPSFHIHETTSLKFRRLVPLNLD